jgi:hypothetical protein
MGTDELLNSISRPRKNNNFSPHKKSQPQQNRQKLINQMKEQKWSKMTESMSPKSSKSSWRMKKSPSFDDIRTKSDMRNQNYMQNVPQSTKNKSPKPLYQRMVENFERKEMKL